MKIRIQGNSIRYRLKQFEVEAFAEKGLLTEIISFGEEEQDQLRFILCTDSNDIFSLKKTASTIELSIPKTIAAKWVNSDSVGFEERVRANKGKEINILVEKDFKCLTRSDEEEAGSYPNPMKQC